jgi:hypothetical protein
MAHNLFSDDIHNPYDVANLTQRQRSKIREGIENMIGLL